MKKGIRLFLICFLALSFGYAFTNSFTLGYIYHDIDLGIKYAIIGGVIFIIYLLVYFSEEIYHKLFKKEEENM